MGHRGAEGLRRGRAARERDAPPPGGAGAGVDEDKGELELDSGAVATEELRRGRQDEPAISEGHEGAELRTERVRNDLDDRIPQDRMPEMIGVPRKPS